MISKAISFMYLFRIFESGLLGGSFATFAIIGGVTEINLLLLLALTVITLNFAIAAWNDSLDLTEDKISHPERPIPSGKITIQEARIAGLLFVILSIIFASLINIKALLVIISGFIIGLGYSKFSKKQFLVKNLTVTIMIMLALLLVPWYFDQPYTVMTILITISVTILLSGYEILKDLRDIEGDSVAGIDTIPLRYTSSVAVNLAAALFIVSCIIMVLSFTIFELLNEALISLIATIALFFPFYWLKKDPSQHRTDVTRYVVIILLGSALTLIGGMMYLRNVPIAI